jgi:integrase
MTNPDRSRLRLVPQNAPLDPPAPADAPPAGVPAKAPSKPDKRRRKHTDPRHRGVKLIPPAGAPGSAARKKQPSWRARYEDPDRPPVRNAAGVWEPAVTFEKLPPKLQPGTIETRRDWAIDKHKSLEARRAELAAGATPRYSGDDLIADVFKLYFAGWGKQNRSRTQTEYRTACDLFLAWCATPGIDLVRVRQLTKGVLRAWAGSRVAVEINPASGRTGPREHSTVNRELRCLSAVLGELRTQEKVHLTRDDISDGLAQLDEDHVKRDFSRVAELRAILAACQRYDVAPPRQKRRGGRISQCDKRMLVIVLFILLTGLRPDEAIWIEWRDIGLDDDGNVLITVRAEVSKTGVERVIDTGHSPLLAHLVSAYRGRTGTILRASVKSLLVARHRLIAEFGAPEFDYQKLRCTCGTYLTCAPAIWGDAAPYMSARQLGHSVTIAQKHYVGVVKVSHEARTTEAAMQLSLGQAADGTWPAIDLATCPRF